MIFERTIKAQIIKRLTSSHKVVIVYGPRQVGKTTLCQEVIGDLGLTTLSVNADEPRFHDVLSSRDTRKLLPFVEGYDLLFIDEAQRIRDIGINLKILIDECPHLKILVTGSSSFELANTVTESLTGRNWSFQLYPLAQLELRKYRNPFELEQEREERLVWGSYPEIFHYSNPRDREAYMQRLSADYLYKDIFALANIRHSEKIHSLLTLLAFQIGKEVSLSELASQLDITKETVARYIDLFVKTFVIFRLGGYSRNLRKEVTKMSKYYFVDLGVRNAVIDNYKPLSLRNDVGELWENFLIVERMKRNAYLEMSRRAYFWRTYAGGEIDYIEDGDALSAFELKWKPQKVRAPRSWRTAYPEASWTCIHQDNWLDFIL